MGLLRSLFTSLISLGALCAASSSAGSRVLVVLEPALSKTDYSTFFDGLEERGYQLTFRTPKQDKPLLVEYDVPNYDHVILFAPTTKTLSSDISPQSLLQLLSQKVNLMVALSPKTTPMHSFASEFGLILPPPETPLFSHFPARKGPRTTLEVPLNPDSSVVKSTSSPILFSGINFGISTNPMLFSIVNAPAESFATDTTKEEEAEILIESANRGGEGLWAGSAMSVVAGFQTKSGARVVWAGGVDMFSNDFASSTLAGGKKSGNAAVAQDIAKWAFQESMVLRIDEVKHHRLGESDPREMYTINDKVVYSVQISAFDPTTSSWTPYSDIKDLQVEFTMLDPHIRTSLSPVAGQPGRYETVIRIPDRHGVFKFVVDYRRRGWSTLYSATTVPVVPPRHNEYPRFLSAAWPYYVGAISTSIGFILFSALWLGGAASERGSKKKKE
ncbi:Dolichyl-diphosphooligosaccharide--protein glycosyltransferase 48 kDa subunit Short=Oligosaccharyl transferase 48 kDa subunit; AltName: Full=Oligosaccharyl transferase beta subunit 1 {ECO:0000312/WormBase:T09A5.11}; Flags: Precursor [Serendipita indica DSM 11827]|uniref:Dolichyl-diphosphooligosaccharide--protein glycosyltransferase subunit WBP1 n=1 Tax=Serendipita indica (strain DSM 11827) TaxID=1109443 RepID=G4TM42_SERID|nr:Dolichyl-diphosphooligosaccharide--protein glycosyltransferase 48 kDa subunit Short=Oligosaccharyl transferase 48 kDa subunit; AltName: Full=Oligosaccharyl transferase beta subunit 1 {ECO:0000312/WormBase:T09A5.11}; Flags: Precursor [Serendipita indica DSM 11827]CCA72385.1 related to oligosaccharyl transferase beta subunit-Laccaria bicolor [Serendipita indica DSM 11827]